MVLLITTCGVRDPRYLGQLLKQIGTSGWKGPRVLVSDGPTPLVTGWPTATSPRCEGQMRTYWRALALGLEQARKHHTDRVVILEDDVELCRNALPYLEHARIPRTLDFVTLFDGHAVPQRVRPGIYPVRAQNFFCLQGVLWPTTTIQRLLHAPAASAWKERHSGDILIAKILTGRYYGVHVPNLVQHLGSQSICNPGQKLTGVRTAKNYPGVTFDALTLGRRTQPSPIVLAR